VNDTDGELPEQSLHDAVTGWDADRGPAGLIDAACDALVGGLDSPALRELAGASARDSSWDIRELAFASLDELGIPWPGKVPVGHVVAAGGGVARRSGGNVLRLEVAPFRRRGRDEFQVLVHVDGVEMTARGAGAGVDPYEIFVPDDRLAATAGPRTVPIARCACGVHGCGSGNLGANRRPVRPDGSGPGVLPTSSREVCETVARPPGEWDAAWYATKPTLTGPPSIAGPSWRHRRY
jgi:hypothetical protein